jgi:ribonuclease HII
MKKFDPTCLPPSPDLSFERQAWEQGLLYVAGIDEAGRGALAGPVAAAAIILPACLEGPCVLQAMLEGVRDSKQMTPRQRELWSGRLRSLAVTYGVGFAEAPEIDALGIVPATRLAVRRALSELCLPPQHLLVDYLPLPEVSIPQTSLVKGDARCLSIAAASVLAKTARDGRMLALEALYPGYGFAAHKGYGTLEHRKKIAALGLSPQHRRSFTWEVPA